MSPRSYEVSRELQASPIVVWELLTDAVSYRDWNDAVVSIEGPINLGETITLVSVLDPKRTFKLKVTTLRPPTDQSSGEMVWADAMPLGLFKGERTFTISGTADGPSEFHMVERFSGPLAGLISKAIPDMTESFGTFADGLKSAAESR